MTIILMNGTEIVVPGVTCEDVEIRTSSISLLAKPVPYKLRHNIMSFSTAAIAGWYDETLVSGVEVKQPK